MAEKTSMGEFFRANAIGNTALQNIQQFFAQQQQLMAPIMGMQAMGAIQAGQRARQTLESRLGAMGMVGSGMGEMAKALGSTYASQQIAQQRLQSMMQSLQLASQMGMQSAEGTMNAFTAIRGGEMQLKAAQGPMGGWGSFIGAAGLALPGLGQMFGIGAPAKAK